MTAMDFDVEAALRGAIGHLDSVEFLGGGGQATLGAWRVTEAGDDSVVKILPMSDHARIEREVDALRAVDDLHVMKFREVLDLGDDTVGIRGEFVPGGTIQAKLQAGDWPTEREGLLCARGVLLGLSALHAVERIHRDIKPANVALRDGDWANPVVLDLGLVRDLLNSSITQYPELLGTVPFMAPEQLRLERAVKRTDVFATGTLLFLLVTRELPYHDESADQGLDRDELRRRMLERTTSDRWPRWARVPSATHSATGQLLADLLAPDAYARPSVAAAIERIADLVEEA